MLWIIVIVGKFDSCMLWVGLWAPFIHYIYYLSVRLPIYIKKKTTREV